MRYKKILSFFIPFLLFAADIFLLGLFQQPTVSLLLCFYSAWLFRPNTKQLIFVSLFLLSSISLILYGNFGLVLLYLLPLTLLFYQAQKLLNKTFWLPYVFLTASILTADFLVKPLLLHTSPNILFTGAKLCVNLIIVLIIEKLTFRKVI